MLAFFSAIVMLASCAVDMPKEKGGEVKVTTSSHDPILSLCSFSKFVGDLQTHLKKAEREYLEDNFYTETGSEADYKFYEYYNPEKDTYQLFGFTSAAARTMEKNNIRCHPVRERNRATGEVAFGSFNTDEEYRRIDVSSDTGLVLVDSHRDGDDLIAFWTYEGAVNSDAGTLDHRAGEEIVIGISGANKGKVRHRTYKPHKHGYASPLRKEIRNDFKKTD